MRTRIPVILFLLISLLIGYGPSIGPKVLTFFQRGTIQDLGPLIQYEKPCTTPGSDRATCKTSYVIPFAQIEKSLASFNVPTIGFGVVLRAVAIKCNNDNQYLKTFDDITSPGRDRAESNRYKTFALNLLKCRDDIVIEAWSRPDDLRYGWMSGNLLLGSESDVKTIADISDFYMNDVRLVLATFLLVLSAISNILAKSLGSNYHRSSFEIALPLFAGFNTINSGLLFKVLPIFESGIILNSLSIFLASFATLTITLEELSFLKAKTRKKIYYCVIPFIGALAISPYNSYAVGPLNFFLAILCAMNSIYAKNVTTFFFALVTSLASLRLMGFGGMPHTHLHAIFVGLIAFREVLGKVTVTLRVANLAIRFEKTSQPEQIFEQFKTCLREISVSLENAKVSLFVCPPGTVCRYFSYDGAIKQHNGNTFPDLPPIVAHVLSARAPLCHLSTESNIFKILAKHKVTEINYSSNYLSAFPVIANDRILGVLFLTNYLKTFITDKSGNDRFTTVINLSIKTLADLMHNHQALQELNFSERLRDLTNQLHTRPKDIQTIDQWSLFILKILTESFTCAGFIAELHPETRKLKILATSNYTTRSKEYVRNTDFYAKEDNLHGPVAVSVNRNDVVVIEDVAWLSHVVKTKTYELFRLNETRSCLILPIRLDPHQKDPTTNPVWGVVWLESAITSHFKVELLKFYNTICTTLFESFSKLNTQKDLGLATQTLVSFMPASVAEKLTKGQSTIERDDGFLIMIDLRGSTKISTALGGEGYACAIQNLRLQLEPVLLEYGFCLQELIWDAFYFTWSNSALKTLPAETLDQIAKNICAVVTAWSIDLNLKIDLPQPVRICVTNGDITRGFTEGKTRSWTIVGSAMAIISKMETECKTLNGVLFADATVIDDRKNWEFTGASINSKQTSIYRLKSIVGERAA